MRRPLPALALTSALAVAAAVAGVLALTGQFASATHVPLPTMAVDTVTTGNTYTADPNTDTNNQDNSIVVGTIDECRTVAMPATNTTVTIHVLLKNAPDVVYDDIRLNLRDTSQSGALLSTSVAIVTAANATPFSDFSQDTDGDGTPDLNQAVGFLNLPVEPDTVGTLGGTTTGGSHRGVTVANNGLSTASAFHIATYNPGASSNRTFHVSPDHPHLGTEVENGQVAPYQASSLNGGVLATFSVRVLNQASPYVVYLDLQGSDSADPQGAGTDVGLLLSDEVTEEQNFLPEANLADGRLAVGFVTCPGAGTPTPAPAKFGDVDCSGSVGIADAQKTARYAIALSVSQTEPCPDHGTTVTIDGTERKWGDVDCNGEVKVADAQKTARYAVQLSVSQTEPCPDIGTDVVVGAGAG